jgi:hypothetical protein
MQGVGLATIQTFLVSQAQTYRFLYGTCLFQAFFGFKLYLGLKEGSLYLKPCPDVILVAA